MEKLKMHSPDITQENIAKLAELFPNCVTEAQDESGNLKPAIDFDQLRQELSDHVVDGPRERYRLDWPGKREALLAANAPIAKTLRPCREESVDFDTTKNLFIEGDNLDVLRLLQETYLNKVKLIYIDPPYNTGNDFIYDDDFAETSDDYLHRSNQVDIESNRLIANTESNGRFHSDWVSMMYSRLKLSRNLLKEDGVIFISIDQRESANLRMACNEVFGEHNFLGEICVVSNLKGRSDDKFFATAHNYLLAYTKAAFVSYGVEMPKEYLNEYPEIDSKGARFRLQGLRKRGTGARRKDRPNMFYEFFVDPKSGRVSVDLESESAVRVVPKLSDGEDGRWRWGKDTARERLDELVGRQVGSDGRWDIFQIDYAESQGELKRIKPKTVWMGPEFSNESGTLEVKNLLGKGIFDTPKPVSLVSYIIQQSVRDGIVLDFFAGSCSTAHATFALNAEDGGKRRFIMVQLPEPCTDRIEAMKSGFKTIADIGKERIRRAGIKIKDEAGLQGQNVDIGFRVLKVDTSNMKDVYYKPDAVKKEDLFDHIENIKEDRTLEDLLFQVLLDWGVDLSLPIAKGNIDGKTVFFVDGNALAACFDTGVTEELVKKIAARKPLRVVFRDAAFSEDSVKINIEQIFKLMSPGTEVKAI
jgi:adenine-specific DNA-methyltransferase